MAEIEFGMRNAEVGSEGRRNSEVGVWNAEFMNAEMITMADERADLTKWRCVSVMSQPNRKPVDVCNVIWEFF